MNVSNSATPPRSSVSSVRLGLAISGTVLFLVGGGLVIAGLYVGNQGNPLFYWAYTGFAGRVPQLVAFFLGLVLLLGGIVMWIAAGAAPNAEQSAARHSVHADAGRARSVAAQAEQIKQWEEAYALAHDGEFPPPGSAPPIAVPLPKQTNTLAILALVFGVLGSVLGIVFGYLALGQIRTTGQSGRGLALAGLVIGYAQMAVAVLVVIVALRGVSI